MEEFGGLRVEGVGGCRREELRSSKAPGVPTKPNIRHPLRKEDAETRSQDSCNCSVRKSPYSTWGVLGCLGQVYGDFFLHVGVARSIQNGFVDVCAFNTPNTARPMPSYLLELDRGLTKVGLSEAFKEGLASPLGPKKPRLLRRLV